MKRTERGKHILVGPLLVTLPDGFEVLEVENRNGDCVALYIDTPVRNQDRPQAKTA